MHFNAVFHVAEALCILVGLVETCEEPVLNSVVLSAGGWGFGIPPTVLTARC